MIRKKALLLGATLALAALALTGCPEGRHIGDISNDPGRYYEKEVTVYGRVTRSYGVAGVGVYEVDDGTGRIWVYTDKYGVPPKDVYIGVTGRVTPGITYDGRNYGNGMHETRRRTRTKN